MLSLESYSCGSLRKVKVLIKIWAVIKPAGPVKRIVCCDWRCFLHVISFITVLSDWWESLPESLRLGNRNFSVRRLWLFIFAWLDVFSIWKATGDFSESLGLPFIHFYLKWNFISNLASPSLGLLAVLSRMELCSHLSHLECLDFICK